MTKRLRFSRLAKPGPDAITPFAFDERFEKHSRVWGFVAVGDLFAKQFIA